MARGKKNYHNISRSYLPNSYENIDGQQYGRKVRRNAQGNLIDLPTFDEDAQVSLNYDYSDFDSEDDHDSYYDSEGYD